MQHSDAVILHNALITQRSGESGGGPAAAGAGGWGGPPAAGAGDHGDPRAGGHQVQGQTPRICDIQYQQIGFYKLSHGLICFVQMIYTYSFSISKYTNKEQD